MSFLHRLLFGHLQEDDQRVLDSVVSRLSKPSLNACVELERLCPNPINGRVADLRDAKALAPAIAPVVGTANEALPLELQCSAAGVRGIEARKSRKLSKMTIAKSRKIHKSAPFLDGQPFLLESIGPKHCAQSPYGAVHVDIDERAEVYVSSWLFHDFECGFEDRAFAKGTSDRTGMARIIVAYATKIRSTCYSFLGWKVILMHAWATAATHPEQQEVARPAT